MPSRTTVQLLLLASATFIFVTFEVYPVGLILDMADDLGVSEGRIGLLVSGYAVISACVTIPSVLLATRLPRMQALLLSLAALLASEIMTALADSYALLATSRVLAAVTHGLFWSLVPPIAAALVPPAKMGRTTAVVFSGASFALVVGSPATTLLGHLIGWRETAVLLAIWTAATVLGLWLAIPNSAVARAAPSASTEHDLPQQPEQRERWHHGPADWQLVTVICAVCLVQMTANFLSYTYFAVIVDAALGGSGALVVLLTLFGISGAVGTLLVGRYNDRNSQVSTLASMIAFAVSAAMLTIGGVAGPAAARLLLLIAAVALWGIAYGSSGPAFQSAIIRVSGRHQELASAIYVSCFQVGIAAGSGLGAVIIGAASATALPIVMLGLGAVVIAAVAVFRRAYANTPGAPPKPATADAMSKPTAAGGLGIDE